MGNVAMDAHRVCARKDDSHLDHRPFKEPKVGSYTAWDKQNGKQYFHVVQR